MTKPIPWAAVVGPLPDPTTFAVRPRPSARSVLTSPTGLAIVVGGVTLLSAVASSSPGIGTLLAPRAGLLVAALLLGTVARRGRARWITLAMGGGMLLAQAWAMVETVRPLLDGTSAAGQACPALAGQACLLLTLLLVLPLRRHQG
jgi:hypothetical protein